jgi:hypothetical protein
VVGTNSDPSDAINIWISFFFSFAPLHPRYPSEHTPSSRVTSSALVERTFDLSLDEHTPALGSSGGRHGIPDGSRGQHLTSIVGSYVGYAVQRGLVIEAHLGVGRLSDDELSEVKVDRRHHLPAFADLQRPP